MSRDANKSQNLVEGRNVLTRKRRCTHLSNVGKIKVTKFGKEWGQTNRWVDKDFDFY